MSKATEQSLIIPGEAGWEIWQRQGTEPFTLKEATEVTRAADIAGIPGGDLLMCFPVKAITALPMKVASDDESLFDDLATLHAERLGLRPDPMAGQLTDLFVIERREESASLLEILLRAPREGEMPPRGPKEFDVSARALSPGNFSLAIWKEFGRWVFAIHHGGKLIYCQATTNDAAAPDTALAREIRLALIQLEIQGMATAIPNTVVWTQDPDLEPREFAIALKSDVTTAPRPVPVWPQPSSRLLPADVRAARREAAKRRTIILGAAAAAAVYLGIIGWFALQMIQDNRQAKRLNAVAASFGPAGEAVAIHNDKWDELSLALDIANDPIDILSRVHRSIPPNSGLRLRQAEISAAQISLRGEAPQSPAVNQFNLALNRNGGLLNFTWQNPEPSQSARGWEFVFTGTSELNNPTQ